jgi:hypothetical protein
MTPDAAVGVARSTYAVYGYALPDDYLSRTAFARCCTAGRWRWWWAPCLTVRS